jgi:hypothetical protein
MLMRRALTFVAGAVAVAAILTLGIAVAGLASNSRLGAIAQTTDETTETTEQPTTTRYRAALTIGAEVPRPNGTRAGARGTFVVPLTNSGGTYSIAWTLTFRNLTGRAQAAHIHRGRIGKAGPVLVGLCGPCRSGQKGKRNVSRSVAAAIGAGTTYVNVHTARNPAGEIRGQIRKVR